MAEVARKVTESGNGASAPAKAPPEPPAAEPTTSEPVASGPSASDELVEKMLGGMTQLIAPEETDDVPAPDEAAPEPEPEPAKPEPQQSAPDYDDFSDDRPWTPDRIKAGAEQLRGARRKMQNWYNSVESREERIQRARGKLQDEKNQYKILHDRISVDVNALFNGTPEQALESLARFRGGTAEEAYEALSYAILGKRKAGSAAPQRDPEVLALLDSVNKRLEKFEQQGQQQTRSEQRRGEIRDGITDGANWPLLAGEAGPDPSGAVGHILAIINRNSWEELDTETVLDRIERELRKRQTMASGAPTSLPSGSGPGAEREPAVKSPKGTAQRSPGRTVTPSLSTESGGKRRPRTEQERRDAFARAMPEDLIEQLSRVGM
jgi:hypothetical protein